MSWNLLGKFSDIKEGDQLRVRVHKMGTNFWIYGTAAQDAELNDHYASHPDQQYVNVKWDDVTYIGYHYNDTLYSNLHDEHPGVIWHDGKRQSNWQWTLIYREENMTNQQDEAIKRIEAAEAELKAAREALEEAKKEDPRLTQLRKMTDGTAFRMKYADNREPHTVTFVKINDGTWSRPKTVFVIAATGRKYEGAEDFYNHHLKGSVQQIHVDSVGVI